MPFGAGGRGGDVPAREPLTPADQQFTKEVGRRLATLRQEARLTQHVLAEELGIAQQTLADYEVGRLRLSVALVPELAQLFSMPTDVLLGVPGAAPAKRGPASQLQRRLERLTRLPKAKQQVILAMLDGVLQQA